MALTLAVSVPVAAGEAPATVSVSMPASTAAAEPRQAPASEAGASLRVFLMTMGPGDQVWERFGHNAIWIHDAEAGTDLAYNYGLFSFDQPGFLRRFLLGRMEYWMGGADAYRTAAEYRLAERSVWIQELNLTPAQRVALRDYLEWNERPENTYYRYDYYRDNCSTRVRDALDRVLGGAIRATLAPVPAGETYRSHTRRLTESDLAIYSGLEVAMGHPVDQPISAWEETFLPMKLRERIREVALRGPDGSEVPLVIGEQTLYEADRPELPADPARPWPLYLIAGLLLGGVLVTLGVAAASGVRGARAGFAMVAGGWLLAVGILGLVLSLLWGVTDHYVAYRNENLLQVHPLALVLGALIVAGVRRPRIRAAVEWLAVAIAAAALVGLGLKLVPPFHQSNESILALMVPAHLGLAFGAWILCRSEAPARKPNPQWGRGRRG